jgi:WD40 repeat protein
MLHRVLALVALGLVLAPVRAAEPKPLWEIETTPKARLLHLVRWVGYSPDGKMLVAQVADEGADEPLTFLSHRLFVWEVETHKELQKIELTSHRAHGWGMYASATTRTGSILVAGKDGEEIRLADGARVKPRKLDWSVGAWFNRDGSDSLWLTTDDSDKYRFKYGKMPPPVRAEKRDEAREQWLETALEGEWHSATPVVTASDDLTRLAVARWSDHKLVLYNITAAGKLALTEVAAVPLVPDVRPSYLRFSPDGKVLATGGHDASVALWDVEKAGKEWKPRATIALGNFPVEALAFSPDGRTLAAAARGRGGNLHIIDVTAGKLHVSYRLAHGVYALAYSPDGKVLATGHTHGRVATWNAGALRNP